MQRAYTLLSVATLLAAAVPIGSAEDMDPQIPNCILIVEFMEDWRFGLDHFVTFATRIIDGCGTIQGLQVFADTDPLCTSVCDWVWVGSILHCIPRPSHPICQPLPVVAQEIAWGGFPEPAP